MDIRTALSRTQSSRIENLYRTAEHLLAHVLNKPREWVIAHPEHSLTPEQQTRFTDLTTQAANGIPLPYLLGHWEFFGLDFVVTPDVLIPRPETELLVEKVIQKSQISKTQNPKIADVGTGSGIIAITLATKLPHAHITATDISPAALAVAQSNAQRHHVADRITFVESDLLASPTSIHSLSFDIICANLPYIPSNDLASLAVAQHEPILALDGGPDGLSLIRRLLTQAPPILAPGGRILLEIEYRQGVAVAALARNSFPTAQVHVHQDLAGLDRVVEINTNTTDH
jgi:release factor glutamine methyltransferase